MDVSERKPNDARRVEVVFEREAAMSMTSSPTEPVFARPLSRSQSRASSRCSTRSFQQPAPSYSLDDPGTSPLISVAGLQLNDFSRCPLSTTFSAVSVRNHISVLKHSIRHQQAQLQSLEHAVQQRASWSSPSPFIDVGLGLSVASPLSAISDLPSYASSPPTFKMARRIPSYEVLQGMAGPESLLPLPLKDGQAGAGSNSSAGAGSAVGVIKEGVPTTLGAEIRTRSNSPTRSLSSAYGVCLSPQSSSSPTNVLTFFFLSF